MKRTIAAVAATILIALVPGNAAALPKGHKVQTYKGGLSFPIDMAWVDGTKKIFFTEKNTGKIRILKGKRLLDRACVKLDVRSDGESGLLGLTLHPRFKKNHLLYVYWTDDSPVQNRVTRFKVVNDRCTNKKTIIKGIRYGGGYHNGGQLEFSKGKLFVSVGEAHDPAAAQDTEGRLGKILRLTADGSVPNGNPFNNEVWSYGHRNPFGLASRPGTSLLYETENGPSCDDELNLIRKGRNYGWGSNYQCGTSGVGSDPKGPLRRYGSVIVPTDLWWYSGRLDMLNNELLMGDFHGDLHAFKFKNNGTAVKKERIVYRTSGITDVSKGPGGWPYFMTTDGIFRIVKR